MDKQSSNDKVEPKKEGGSEPSQLNAGDIFQGNEKIRLPASADKGAKDPPIGVAELKDNETIVLHLKGKRGDLSGEAEVEYKLGDKLYDEVYKHIGGIKKGETKLVPAWQDALNDNQEQKPKKQSTVDEPKAPEQVPPKDTPQDPPTKQDDANGDPGKSVEKPGDSQTTKPGDTQVTKPGDQSVATPDVILPPSTQFVTTVTDTYAKMSPEVRELLNQDGTVVTPTRRITDALPELKGQKPRGWPPGLTWDAVDGAYSPNRNLVVVAEETRDTSNQWVKSKRTEDVTRHEVGHATDYAINKLSDSNAYTQAYEDDIKAMPAALTGTLKYFLQSGDGGKEEACAEGIAVREGGSTSGKVFESGFPKSIAAIDAALLVYRAKLPTTAGTSGPGSTTKPIGTDAPGAESGTGSTTDSAPGAAGPPADSDSGKTNRR